MVNNLGYDGSSVTPKYQQEDVIIDRVEQCVQRETASMLYLWKNIAATF